MCSMVLKREQSSVFSSWSFIFCIDTDWTWRLILSICFEFLRKERRVSSRNRNRKRFRRNFVASFPNNFPLIKEPSVHIETSIDEDFVDDSFDKNSSRAIESQKNIFLLIRRACWKFSHWKWLNFLFDRSNETNENIRRDFLTETMLRWVKNNLWSFLNASADKCCRESVSCSQRESFGRSGEKFCWLIKVAKDRMLAVKSHFDRRESNWKKKFRLEFVSLKWSKNDDERFSELGFILLIVFLEKIFQRRETIE